jgi:hypothetical protein
MKKRLGTALPRRCALLAALLAWKATTRVLSQMTLALIASRKRALGPMTPHPALTQQM